MSLLVGGVLEMIDWKDYIKTTEFR